MIRMIQWIRIYILYCVNRFRDSCPALNDFESKFGELFVSTICNNNHHNFTSDECNNRDIVYIYINNNK